MDNNSKLIANIRLIYSPLKFLLFTKIPLATLPNQTLSIASYRESLLAFFSWYINYSSSRIPFCLRSHSGLTFSLYIYPYFNLEQYMQCLQIPTYHKECFSFFIVIPKGLSISCIQRLLPSKFFWESSHLFLLCLHLTNYFVSWTS